MRILLDTDVAIEILRARNSTILSMWSALSETNANTFYSPVTAAEVWGGAFPQEYALIARFFRPLICLPSDGETGRLAGDLLRDYRKSHSLEVPDALIAAAAVQHRLALWTRNRKHYPMPQLEFYA